MHRCYAHFTESGILIRKWFTTPAPVTVLSLDPMLKKQDVHSNPVPRTLCTSAANEGRPQAAQAIERPCQRLEKASRVQQSLVESSSKRLVLSLDRGKHRSTEEDEDEEEDDEDEEDEEAWPFISQQMGAKSFREYFRDQLPTDLLVSEWPRRRPCQRGQEKDAWMKRWRRFRVPFVSSWTLGNGYEASPRCCIGS